MQGCNLRGAAQHATPSTSAPAPRLSRRARRHVAAAAPPKEGSSRLEPAIELRNGAVVEGPSLACTVNGLHLPNPFIIGSGACGCVLGRVL